MAKVIARPVEAGETPPTEFILIHKGKNDSTNGAYVFDDLAAKLVMKAYKDHGVECMFDYGHGSLEEKPVSYQEAIKAAGYYYLEVRDGDLWATNIRWTPVALDMFSKKEVKYFSPAFFADGSKLPRVTQFINCALTNLPASKDNQPLVNAIQAPSSETSEAPTKDINMAEETPNYELQLKELNEKLSALTEENKDLLVRIEAKKVAEKVCEDDEEDDEDEDEKKSSKKLSLETRDQINEEVIRLSIELAKYRAASTVQTLESKVKGAIKKGIITPAQKNWALSNSKAFDKLCEAFKGVVLPQQPEQEVRKEAVAVAAVEKVETPLEAQLKKALLVK